MVDEPERKRQKFSQEDGNDISQHKEKILKMSALGMSTAQIADVWHMNVTEVVRLLNQDPESSGQGKQALRSLVKRLMEDPTEFCCPVSHELMEDPVVAGDGFTYERSCIEDWLKERRKSPMTGATIKTSVLNPNQDKKSAIIAFKEETVAEILRVAPQLTGSDAANVLNRAEHFVRSNLPDAAARRKLSAVLLQRAKLPGVGKGGVIQELVSLLLEMQDDEKLQQFLCETEESELLSLLWKLDEEMVTSLHKTIRSASMSGSKPCRKMINKELACRFANRSMDDERLKKLWDLLQLKDVDDEEDWTKAAAVVLATFIDRLEVVVADLGMDVLSYARAYVEDHDSAKAFAEQFFSYDLGIANEAPTWPPQGSAKIFAEIASRIDDTHEEKLRFLMRAHEIDDFDDMIRKTLVKQLHHSIAQEWVLERGDGLELESLYLKLVLEDEQEISEEVMSRIRLAEDQLKALTAEQLMLLSAHLDRAGRCNDAARLAVDAAKHFAAEGHDEESQNALLKAFRMDRNNGDAWEGLVDVVSDLRREFKAKCRDVDELKRKCRDLEKAQSSKSDELPLMSFIWDLSSYDFQDFSKGERLNSDKFFLSSSGIRAWLVLVPKGCKSSKPDKAGGILYMDRAAKVKVKIHSNVYPFSRWDIDQDFSKSCVKPPLGYGNPNFMDRFEVESRGSISIHLMSIQAPNSTLRCVGPGSTFGPGEGWT